MKCPNVALHGVCCSTRMNDAVGFSMGNGGTTVRRQTSPNLSPSMLYGRRPQATVEKNLIVICRFDIPISPMFLHSYSPNFYTGESSSHPFPSLLHANVPRSLFGDMFCR